MFRIEAIKIDIHTNNGLFGRSMTFKKGLNIIRADNTSGKSSLFGALIYGLGFEELLGSRNEMALHSVFKSIIQEKRPGETDASIENTVTQSEIYLQITNGQKSITTKRFVIHGSIKPQAVEVFDGAVLTDPTKEYERIPMYVHDKGSASNEDVGFHKFFENFIGVQLPEVLTQEGKRVKLFLPLLASAHFIEQKSGWSDFFANIPYYAIREAQLKVFEFILNLDVFESSANRQEIQNQFRELEERWKLLAARIKSAVEKGGGEVAGIPELPEILSAEIRPYTKFYRGDKSLLLKELIDNSKEELQTILSEINKPINENTDVIQDKLRETKELNERYEVFYDSLSSEISQEKERLRQYLIQKKNISEELQKNKDALKITQLGLDAELKIAKDICPTCNQGLHSLLDANIVITPMRIDENIALLNSQLKMAEAFIANIRENVLTKETKLAAVEVAIQTNRQRIRSLKRDMVSDDRLPSEGVIERKIVLERELNFLYKLRDEIEELFSTLYSLSKEFELIKSGEAGLRKEYLSSEDKNKLIFFENSFKSLLSKFGFTSKPVDTIRISPEKYSPVYEIKHANGINRQVDIRFESSASDFIRAQWAYYTSLMKTSISKSGNHFLTLLFDEPQQQSASVNSFKALLKELETFREEQVIILASFQNSDEDYKESIKDLTYFHEIDLTINNQLLIERLQGKDMKK